MLMFIMVLHVSSGIKGEKKLRVNLHYNMLKSNKRDIPFRDSIERGIELCENRFANID